MAGPKAQLNETPNAALAFRDFVGMGPQRSLRKLHDAYCLQTAHKPPTKRFETLADWSVKYTWQDRLAGAASAHVEALLNEAAELDADTFLITSRHLQRQVDEFSSYPETVIKIRESVRKPMPKGGAQVSVNVSVEVRQMIDRIAEEDGLTDAEKHELETAVERHLAGTKA